MWNVYHFVIKPFICKDSPGSQLINICGYVVLILDAIRHVDIIMFASYYVAVQCVPEKRKPINQVKFTENYNDLS